LNFHEAIGAERIRGRLHFLKRHWAEQVQGEKLARFAASLDARLYLRGVGFDIVGETRDENH
jgi:hypothetical protein